MNLPYPDLNLFLDVPTSVTRERLESQRNGSDREYLQGKQDVHEADITFQEQVRKNYISFMEGAVNCKIISCAYSLGEVEHRQWLVLKPQDLFDTYKKYLDYVIFNTAL